MVKHSVKTKAEKQLNEALDLTRSTRNRNAKLSSKPNANDLNNTTSSSGTVMPRPPALSEEAEEKRRVTVLELKPSYNERSFEGLERLKVTKKDRHIKTVDGFSKMLDKLSDRIEQELLQLSRNVRDDLEEKDDIRNKFYLLFKESDFMIIKEEDDVLQLKKDTIKYIEERNIVVENFAKALDELERLTFIDISENCLGINSTKIKDKESICNI